ncbi:MAG: 50S ribosomal protein L3 N(5)-glutamine methyltransferase [Opitutaceae bacterium]
MPPKKARKKTRSSPVAGTAGLVTIGDWLRFAVTTLHRETTAFVQGLHDPQEEATFLVSRHLGLAQEDLPHFLGARLTASEVASLRELIRQRVEKHVPAAYLVKEAVLNDVAFHVDERVLIPRSYIAELLPEDILAFAGEAWMPQRILELGTGCGCLAVLAARAFGTAIVDAADISNDALEVATINIHAHGLENRVHLIHSDLFDGVPPIPYDLIIANPPYEPSALVDEQPPEIAHEPRLALDGGVDGMSLVRRIVQESRAHLARDGVLVLELGGLRLELLDAFPKLRPHVFNLHDGSDAVLGFRAKDLPK